MPKKILTETYKNKVAIQAADRALWRTWLEQHHDKERSVWLILFRKGHEVESVGYAEAVEEALCFGWIDSVVNKRDEYSKYQYFSPRKPKSGWSTSNKERVHRMTAAGLMAPAGQALIDLAKTNGAWESLEKVEQEQMPDDFGKALKKDKTALKNYNAFPPSARKLILHWIFSAKRPETRQQRIAQTVELAAQNIRAHQHKKY